MNEESRDRTVREALRRVLEPGDEGRFAARVLARLDTAGPKALFWNTLAAWAKPGIPAAAALAVLAAFFMMTRPAPEVTLEDALVGNDLENASAFLTYGEPPDPGVLIPGSEIP